MKICLNMIVKNEENIILECLISIYKYIDTYCIVDTGSTDNTKEIIHNFFTEKKIDGVIIDHDPNKCLCHPHKTNYFDFSMNRNYALEKGRTMGDYLFIMDADDYLVGDFKYPDNMTLDGYYLKVKGSDGVILYRPLILRSSSPWQYVNVVHEMATLANATIEKIDGNYDIIGRSAGSHSKNPDRTKQEKEIFKNLLKENPRDPRAYHFLAEHYFKNNNLDKALFYYRSRLSIEEDGEDAYYCCRRVGHCLEKKGEPDEEIINTFLTAYKFMPDRGEALYDLVIFLLKRQKFNSALFYASIGCNLSYPKDHLLFIQPELYSYLFRYLKMISLFYLKEIDAAVDEANKILNFKNIDEKIYQRAKYIADIKLEK